MWCENGDLVEVLDNRAEAEDMVESLNQSCPCGEKSCGVMSPHGYHVQVVDGNYDVTGSY